MKTYRQLNFLVDKKLTKSRLQAMKELLEKVEKPAGVKRRIFEVQSRRSSSVNGRTK